MTKCELLCQFIRGSRAKVLAVGACVTEPVYSRSSFDSMCLCEAEAEICLHVSTQKMLYAACEHAAKFAVTCNQHSACLM